MYPAFPVGMVDCVLPSMVFDGILTVDSIHEQVTRTWARIRMKTRPELQKSFTSPISNERLELLQWTALTHSLLTPLQVENQIRKVV